MSLVWSLAYGAVVGVAPAGAATAYSSSAAFLICQGANLAGVEVKVTSQLGGEVTYSARVDGNLIVDHETTTSGQGTSLGYVANSGPATFSVVVNLDSDPSAPTQSHSVSVPDCGPNHFTFQRSVVGTPPPGAKLNTPFACGGAGTGIVDPANYNSPVYRAANGTICSYTATPVAPDFAVVSNQCAVTGDAVCLSNTAVEFHVLGTGTITQTVTYLGSGYNGLTPSRILDSRTMNGGWNAKLDAGTPRDLKVTALGGASNVPVTAAAVVMNVTATGSSQGSFVSVWPSGTAQPNASNLNFGAGQTIPNLVTVKVGVGGKVAFANAVGSVDVIADVVGYYDDGTDPGDLYNGVTPTRLLDSRTATGNWNGALNASTPRDLAVRQPANPNGVPSTATAVIANVTATGGSAGSFMSVWPTGVTQPTASNLNFGAGQTIPNLAIVKVGANGSIRFANAVGSVDVIVDVVGYFDSATGSKFHAVTPTRVLDDRVNNGLSGPWGPNQSRALGVAGAAASNVPAGATGVVANVTATGATAGSFVTVYPDGAPLPNSSNLNFGPGQTIPNLATVKVPENGKVTFYNKLGSVDLIADVVGYYAAT